MPGLRPQQDEHLLHGALRFVDGGQLAPGGDHRVATHRLDRVNGQDADDLVAGGDRTVVDEPLLAVDKPAVVDPSFRVNHELPVTLLGDQDGECGWGDHIAVAASTSLHLVDVYHVFGAHRLGELADLLPAHDIRRSRWVGVPGEPCIDGHGDHPRGWAGPLATALATGPHGGRRTQQRPPPAVAETAAIAWDQRVSRCVVCLVQRGQNLANSNRSGLLRRFFLVM